jgi:hypothetical protein
MALLASNEAVYFYSLEHRYLIGTRFFNKRHHGSKNVLFNPTMSNILVVYGGPNGMTIYKILDLSSFNQKYDPAHGKGKKD